MRKKDQVRSRTNAYRRSKNERHQQKMQNIIAEIRGCIRYKNLPRAHELANIHGLSDDIRRRLGLRPKPRWTYA